MDGDFWTTGMDAWEKGVSETLFFLPLMTDFFCFFFFTEAVAVLSLVLTPFFQNYLFVGATSVPVSRGLGSTERDAWFGGSVDTLIRNIMIFSNINLLDTRL
jgi:hypothetical protein